MGILQQHFGMQNIPHAAGVYQFLRNKSMTKPKKIPPWAWAVSGLLVGVVFAWIAIEAITASGQPLNGSQSVNSGGQPAAQSGPSAGAAPQIQANANTATNEQLAQAQAENARLQAAQNQASLAVETTQMMGMMGKTLSDYYGEVMDAQGLGQLWCLIGSQCETNFWAAFAQQALGEDSLKSAAADSKIEATYHTLTGSYTYVDAKKQLDELVFASYGADVQSSDSDEVKIEKILGFIDAHVHYGYDMRETPQAAAETLEQQSGDCKDFSILASAALADAGIPSAIMRMKNVSGEGSGHAMILIQSNDNLPLYGSYADLTKYGLSSGRWWIIEPQYTLVQQTENPSWFKQWEIVNAAMVGSGTASVQQAQGGDNDLQRIADMHEVQNALEAYFNKNGKYPVIANGTWATLQTTLIGAGIGINTVPNDPNGGTYYYGTDANGTIYIVAAKLKNGTGGAWNGYQVVSTSNLTTADSDISGCTTPDYCMTL